MTKTADSFSRGSGARSQPMAEAMGLPYSRIPKPRQGRPSNCAPQWALFAARPKDTFLRPQILSRTRGTPPTIDYRRKSGGGQHRYHWNRRQAVANAADEQTMQYAEI